MPEVDPLDARLTAAVHAYADRAVTRVAAAAVAERAIGRRRSGAVAWLGRPLPVSASIVILAGLLLAVFGWSLGSGGRWDRAIPAPVATPTPTEDAVPSADSGRPAHVSGTETLDITAQPTSDDGGRATQLRDGVATVAAAMTDARVGGTGTFTFSADAYPVVGPAWGTFHLDNENGAWDGTCSGGTRSGGARGDGWPAIWTCWLVGSGGYEGFTYYRHVTSIPGETRARVEGIVFPGAPPTP
jgi:hypothetical protein